MGAPWPVAVQAERNHPAAGVGIRIFVGWIGREDLPGCCRRTGNRGNLPARGAPSRRSRRPGCSTLRGRARSGSTLQYRHREGLGPAHALRSPISQRCGRRRTRATDRWSPYERLAACEAQDDRNDQDQNQRGAEPVEPVAADLQPPRSPLTAVPTWLFVFPRERPSPGAMQRARLCPKECSTIPIHRRPLDCFRVLEYSMSRPQPAREIAETESREEACACSPAGTPRGAPPPPPSAEGRRG